MEKTLNEAIMSSTTRVTKGAKLQRLGGGFSMRLAKESKDPLYMRYQKARQIMLDTKAKIMRKYGTKGKMAARKASMK